jgi:hypothetical protein
MDAKTTAAKTTQRSLLMDLEARHDELMLRLDELDKRVQKTLTECQVVHVATPPSSSVASQVNALA